MGAWTVLTVIAHADRRRHTDCNSDSTKGAQVTQPYKGHSARIYDALYAEKPYHQEAQWIFAQSARIIGAPPKMFLDVACGTGRHAEQFARHGGVVGIDLSADMIAVARERLSPLGPSASVFEGDMAALETDSRITERSVDVASCLFDALGYARTNERVSATLRGMARAIRSGGAVVVEVWHAAAMLSKCAPVRVRRATLGRGSEVVRIAETKLNVEEQVARVHYTTHELIAGGHWRIYEESHVNRFFLAQELKLLFSQAGLDVREMYGGFSDAAVDGEAFHIVALATRP
jgi:ubiquinone/menaquinone biosynthesis C-methylase UbiE